MSLKKNSPPSLMQFTVRRQKNGGYLLSWTVGKWQTILPTSSPYRKALSTHAELIAEIVAQTELMK